MSPYIFLFILLILARLLAFLRPQADKIIYSLLLITMTLFLGLREWQGTDYNLYRWLYDIAPTNIFDGAEYFSDQVHSEVGWKVGMLILKAGNIPFELFIFCISCYMMACLNRFINLYSKDKILSLILSYPSLYLVLFFSGIRQGVVVATYLGILLPMLESGKHLCFSLGCVALVSIHSSSFVLLISLLPLVIKKSKGYIALLIGCFVIGLLPLFSETALSIAQHIPSIGYYFTNSSVDTMVGISVVSVLRRVFFAGSIVVLSLTALSGKHNRYAQKIEFLLKIYVIGFGIYLLSIASPSASTRLYFAFQAIEVALIPLLLASAPQCRETLTLLMVMASLVVTCNSLNSFVEERGYVASWYEYPYYSIFTPEETIEAGREGRYGLP
ncbi:EpsG family protein [Thermophilibacter sp.]